MKNQIPTEQPFYGIAAVSFTNVKLEDNFWSVRIATNRTVTIPYGFKKCEEDGRIRNFERAGGMLAGGYEGEMPFDDSDIYKIIEGASYSLQTNFDAELDEYIDRIINKIAAAQEDDGYLCTWKTLSPDTSPVDWVKAGPRWNDLGNSHELYNVGHMYEAAYAHFQATGKRNLLNIALKNADLVALSFGPGKIPNPPGHQVIETGLVKLYRVTHNKKYLELARFFLDQRGNAEGRELYGTHCQDHLPAVEQKEAVGHAVRAAYMYAGMTDIAAIMNDSHYQEAIDNLWENVVEKKIYITGGIGSRHGDEAFGENYQLPNLTSYNETCAAIANIYWNHRMFLLHGDAKYIDVLERSLYNGMIAGVALTGDLFFYPNCMESDGKFEFNHGSLTREPWFDCTCCPTNVIRALPFVPNLIYAQCEDAMYVNLFIANKARVRIQGTDIQLEQRTNYPWDGKILITVNPQINEDFAVKLRIPGWVTDKPLPGNLYYFLDENPQAITLKINGESMDFEIENGYAVLSRLWSKGDVIELNLPVPVRRVLAHEKVEENYNKVALTRGPIVYCAEWPDNGGKVLDIVLPDDTKLIPEERQGLLGGLTIIKGDVVNKYSQKKEFIAIPYYAWSHRGPGEMAVWLLRK